MKFYTYFILKYLFNKNNSFIWYPKNNSFKKITTIKCIDIDLLIGIDRQKKTLIDNTINFAKGNFTNNALLWGSRGSGKSTLIKSLFKKFQNNIQN